MRIDEMEVKNFRGFSRFTLTLEPDCTVLIGNNGAGKSALLDALAVALGAWFIRLGPAELRSRSILDEEIHRVRHEHAGAPSLEPQTPVRVEVSGAVQGRSIRWARALTRPGGRTTYGEASALREIAQEVSRDVQADRPVTLPLIGYYGTGRLWGLSSRRTRRRSSPAPAPPGCVSSSPAPAAPTASPTSTARTATRSSRTSWARHDAPQI